MPLLSQYTRIGCAVVFIFSSPAIFSNEAASELDDVTELSTISVQGQQDSGPEISTQKLLLVPGSGGDPMKAIESLPGVVLDGDQGEPAVRGSSPEDNYYQTDHMPVGYLFHTMGDSIFNPNIIEEFSLHAGAWDSQYSDAIGSVLDTRLRDPYAEPITTTVDLSFLRAGILVEGSVTENSAFYAAWREGLLDWYFDNIKVDEEDIAITQVPKYNDYQLKYHYRLSPVSNLKFLAIGARDTIEIEIGEDFDEAGKEPDLVGEARFHGAFNSQGVTYDTLLPNGISLLVVTSRLEQEFEYKIGTLFKIDASKEEHRLKTHLIVPLQNGDAVRFGVELSENIMNYDGEGKYDPCNDDLEFCGPNAVEQVITFRDRLTLNSVRSHVAYDWLVTPMWQVTVGLADVNDRYLNEHLTEPRVSSRYELSPNWTLTAAVGKHSQMPREFFAIVKDIGNPNLDMPNSEHYVLGFEYSWDDIVSAKLEAYYKDLHDLVISNPQYDEDNTQEEYINGASGHAYGLEFLVNKNLSNNWYGWLSVAYSKAKREYDHSGQQFTYSYDRPWIINLVSSYKLDEKITLGAKWRYQSGNLVTPITGGVPLDEDGNVVDNPQKGADGKYTNVYVWDPIEGEINSERLPAKHTLDLRVDYKKSEMTDIYFEIINAYNRRNTTEYEYSDDYATRDPVSELETLFSVGAKWTF